MSLFEHNSIRLTVIRLSMFEEMSTAHRFIVVQALEGLVLLLLKSYYVVLSYCVIVLKAALDVSWASRSWGDKGARRLL